jgi:hypothetical protein
MSKFSFKSEHFLTPIKLVLPGIIVSLIGASAGYFLFNNPDEKKAKETYRTWKVIREYEDAFKKGNEAFYCAKDSLDQYRFRKDYAHLLEILVNNLQDLKGNKEMDPRISAYLNFKISRYKESMKITDTFLAQLEPVNNTLRAYPDNLELRQAAIKLQFDYASELAHIETRDDQELKRIAAVLEKEHMKYTDSFPVQVEKLQPIAEIEKNVPGKYRFPEVGVTASFNKDNSGLWEALGLSIPFKWEMKDTVVILNFADEVNHFRVVKATETFFSAYWKEKEYFMVGCRREPSLLEQVKNIFDKKK